MSVLEKLHVQIGQVKVGRPGQSLDAILGSCIGLGFLMPDKNVYGLAHALLANSNGRQSEGGGRHVDQAIVSLLKLMEVSDNERRAVRVFLAGGANMTLPIDTDPARLVGSANADFARRAVRAAGLRVIKDDMGGGCGRRVFINCSSGEFSITAIPRIGHQ